MNLVSDTVTAYLEDRFYPLSPALKQFGIEDGKDFLRILPDVEMVLRSLLSMYHPARILEVGMANGYSAAMMATLLPQSQIVTIEQQPQRCQKAAGRFAALGMGNRITICQGDAGQQLRELATQKENQKFFDVLFIDAAKSHYKEYLDIGLDMLKDRCLILSDDVLMRGTVIDEAFDPRSKHKTSIRAMRDYIEYISTMEGAHTGIIPVGDGLAVTYLEK